MGLRHSSEQNGKELTKFAELSPKQKWGKLDILSENGTKTFIRREWQRTDKIHRTLSKTETGQARYFVRKWD